MSASFYKDSANPEMDYILSLKREINKLRNTVRFLNGRELKELLVGPIREDEIKSIIKYCPKWEPCIKEERMIFGAGYNLFITLTFDPSRFGESNSPKSEELYFLDIILSAIQKELLLPPVYGCFELQKNGSIHTHFIANTTTQEITSLSESRISEIRNHFKTKLTDNTQNRNAVHMGNYRERKSLDYINKEEPYKRFYSFINNSQFIQKTLDGTLKKGAVVYDLDGLDME